MLLYSRFYRERGVRLIQQFIKPPLTGVDALGLPANSVYHYTETEPDSIGISPDNDIIAHKSFLEYFFDHFEHEDFLNLNLPCTKFMI